jgi:DNA-binding MarR family transcriptional regulator
MRHNNQVKKISTCDGPGEAVESEARSVLLESLVGYRLRRASNAVMADFMAAVGELGLRPALFAMLAVARENPGINQSALGRALGIQRANLVPLIAELAGRGLIERRPAERDRRAVAVHLTEAGERLLDDAERRIRPHEERMLRGLNRKERENLRDLLNRIEA